MATAGFFLEGSAEETLLGVDSPFFSAISISPGFLMDEILHHLRNPGMMISLYIPTNNGFRWFQGGAGFRPSTVSGPGKQPLSCVVLQMEPVGFLRWCALMPLCP